MTFLARLPKRQVHSHLTPSVDDFFQDFFGDSSEARRASEWTEDEKSFQLALDIPGIKKEDLNIEVNENILSIRGERHSWVKKENVTETESQKYLREFRLGENIDLDQILAKHEDGVLYLELPKMVKEEKKRQIEVK